MKKNQIDFPFAVLLTMLLVSCASTKSTVPLWAELSTLEEAYPSREYIARIGYGANPQEARTLSEAELTSYFEHSVQSKTLSSFSQSMSGTKASEAERTLTQNVNVSADMNLFAVNHTKPWYDKEGRQYICCSFIERKEAWKIYGGRVAQAQKNFLASYGTAISETDPLKRMYLLSKSIPSAQAYNEVLSFAHALYEEGSALYETDRATIAKIPGETERARLSASMRLLVKGDMDGVAERAVTQVLSEKGFLLKTTGAAYDVLVEILPNKAYHEQSITAVPGVSVAITRGSESLFSYAKTLPRESGFKEAESFVDKKIFQSVEAEIKSTLGKELDSSLLAGTR